MEERVIHIVGYSAEYAADFARLNYEWIEHYFQVEDEDRVALDNPQAYAIAPGGEIFFVLVDAQVVGTVALVPKAFTAAGNVTDFELAKMAVDPSVQGQGIGKHLLAHAIEYARSRGAGRIVLSTNDVLTPALTVYRAAGFVEQPAAQDERYRRSNMFMALNIA